MLRLREGEGHGLEEQRKHFREQCPREEVTHGQQDPAKGCTETLAELWEPAQDVWREQDTAPPVVSLVGTPETARLRHQQVCISHDAFLQSPVSGLRPGDDGMGSLPLKCFFWGGGGWGSQKSLLTFVDF